MATKQARRTAASSQAGGYKPSGIGAKARAAASALRNSTPEHLSGDQFGGGGRHAAPSSYGSVRKNNRGSSYTPRHGRNAQHDSGFESPGTGSSSSGRHARFNWFSKG